MPKRRDLLASCWTIAGDTFPGDGSEASLFGFAERVEAAAKAGYRGVGLVHGDLLALRDTVGYGEMRRILDGAGMNIVEVEILTDWFADGERRAISDRVRADLLEASEALRARHIKVSGDMTGVDWPTSQLAEAFASLCTDAARVGTSIGIEIMPWSNFRTIGRTMEVVGAAGAANGGLLLDIWHIVRGGIPMEEIGRLPASAIVYAEIDDSDAVAHDDIWNETLHHRHLCGEGAFDLVRFLDELDRSGYDGPVGVEILSATHRKRPLREAAQRSFETASRLFATDT